MKHTPGPWEHVTYKSEASGSVHSEITPTGTNGWKDGRYMCVNGCIDEYDARLIAAAPDLLEALRKLVAAKDTKEAHGATADYEILRVHGWELARAAIAKATGESRELD